jgi:biopolymer transport protein ExbD
MASSYRKSKKIGMPQPTHVIPNMTPMVDVVMVILIFFMLGSSFASPELFLTNNSPAIGNDLNPPASDPMPAMTMQIKLERFGQHTTAIIGDFQTQDLSGELKDWLTQKKAVFGDKVHVIIWPQGNVTYQDVITVYSVCTKAKYAHVAFKAEG